MLHLQQRIHHKIVSYIQTQQSPVSIQFIDLVQKLRTTLFVNVDTSESDLAARDVEELTSMLKGTADDLVENKSGSPPVTGKGTAELRGAVQCRCREESKRMDLSHVGSLCFSDNGDVSRQPFLILPW